MMSSNSTVNTRLSRPAREKAHKSNNPDHNKSTDGTSAKIQPTADQIRLAQMINDTKDMDDPELQSKIKQVMELTGRSSDEASVALHDCDNDPNRAIDMLLEGQADQGEWETSMKRKKNRPATAPVAVEIVQTQPTVNNNKENKPRLERSKEKPGKERENRNRMPPRMSRGRKGRDSDKNERNLEDGQQPEQHFERRGRGARMMNGPGRGGRGGRGGGRIRTFQSRGGSSNNPSEFPRSIETWTNASADENNRDEDRLRVGNWSDGFPPAEEWDNEDWTGSLAETKVFTPSSNMASTDYVGPPKKHPPPSGLEVSSLNLGIDVANQQTTTLESVSYEQNSLKTINYSQTPVDVASSNVNQSLAFNMNVSENSTFSIPSSQTVAASNVHNEVTLGPTPLSLTSLAVSSGSTRNSSLTMSNATHPSQMGIPSRPKSQRPRGLGTSKIPASAVEMPDDAITTLDVQFGSLEFGSESPKLNLSSLLEATSIQSAPDRPSTISSHLNLNTSNNSSQVLSSSSVANNSSLHMASSLVKASADLDGVPDQSSRISYTSSSATTLAPNPSSVVSVSQTNSSQVLGGSDMMSLGNVNDRKSSYSNLQRSSRPSALDSGVSSSKSVSGVNDSLSTYSVPSYQVNYGSSKVSSAAYSNNLTSSVSSHSNSQSQTMSSLYSLNQQPAAVVSTSGYSQPLTYQSYSNPAITSGQLSTSSSAYGSLNMSMASNKLSSTLNNSSSSSSVVKDVTDPASQHVYDGSNNLASSLTTSSVASSLGLSGSSFTNANSTSSGKSPSTKSFDQGKSGLTSLPPGVPTVLSHPYIMGQAGVPFYSLPQPVYSYEDLQMIQQRMAPMSSFYDMSFQPSNSAMTARDTTGLNNMAAYSAAGNDAKFSRGESSSPVPTSSLPQQSSTQQHQQTFISPTALPPGYGYYYSGGVVAGGFAQYGPQIFPVATATNTHGATSNTHFQKPNAYSSHGYSSGYDSLGQNQDYSKSTYGSASQNQSKAVSGGHMSLQAALGTVNSMSANDMSQSVYSKGHAQMNKSFDKPGFHAGTPPPFNMASAGQTGVGGASTAYTAPTFISMMTHNPSPMLHHQMHQDSSSGSQRAQVNPAQNKTSSTSKQGYGASYWTST